MIEACPKNISTTLPHVKPALTDPAAAGAPPSRCHCQCAPTTPPHCSRTFTTPPPWRCHCQRAPTTLPHCPHIHCTTDLALSLPARQTNATPYHRKCVHANHRPHASGDQAAYSAWPWTHAVQEDMHSANGQDADSRARWLT